MAIFKTANGTGKYRDLRSRSDLISYITNPQKAPNHVFYAMVDPSDPVGHMNRIATQFGKTDGVQARHFVFSFLPTEVNSPSVASCIAQDIALYFGQEYQTVAAVHEDKAHLHIHVITNSISYVDGHRYYGKKREHYQTMKQVRHILRRYGIDRLTYVSASADC